MKTYSRKNSSYIKKAFVASNFNEMCRLCLSEVDMVLTPIFQDYKIAYKDWIQYSVDVLIEEGDGLPSNICEECLAMVEQTYLFKKKCKASDSKLREHLELLEHNEEGKLTEIGLIDVSEDHRNLFGKKESSESKCDESSAVDTGGTNAQEPAAEEEEVNKPLENVEKVSEEKSEVVSEPQEEKVIINKVKRYILRGEKREGDQEEDLTVCEVVPLDVRNEESILLSESESGEGLTFTSLDCPTQNGHLIVSEISNNSATPQEKTGNKIQEIYQLWGNEEEVAGEQETPKSEEIMYLDVSWEDHSDKGIKKQNVAMLEVDVEQNGVVQLHRIYKNKNQIEIIETMPERKSFNCFACKENLPTYTELKEHLAKMHKDVSLSDVAYCEICCKSFTCTNSLKRHMAVHTGFKPYKCKTCDRRFSQGSILKRHVLTHEALKPFNCHICKKSYTQKMNLLSHLKNHGFRTGTESYKCKLCSKSFVHQSGLSRHIKLHKGVRFLCIHCKKSFGDASALTRHVKTVHQQQT